MPITIPQDAPLGTRRTLGSLVPHPAAIGKVMGAKTGITAPRLHLAGGGIAGANSISSGMFQPIQASGVGIPNVNVSPITSTPSFSNGSGPPKPPSSQPQQQQSPMQDIAQTAVGAEGLTKAYSGIADSSVGQSIGNFFTANHGSGFGGVASGPDAATSNSILDSSNGFATGTSINSLAAQNGITLDGDTGAITSSAETIDPAAEATAAATDGVSDAAGTLAAEGATDAAADALPELFLTFAAKGGSILHRAEGGEAQNLSNMLLRREAGETFHPGGLLNSAGPGRTDTINTNVPTGAYVVPADIVAGIGEGNTLSGSAVIDRMFGSSPHGIKAPQIKEGRGIKMPSPPSSAPRAPAGSENGPTVNTSFINSAGAYAKGGNVKPGVAPVVLAGGEHVINPNDIIRKFGSLKKGHRILDEWVVMMRQKIAKEMLKLPPPVGSRIKKK